MQTDPTLPTATRMRRTATNDEERRSDLAGNAHFAQTRRLPCPSSLAYYNENGFTASSPSQQRSRMQT